MTGKGFGVLWAQQEEIGHSWEGEGLHACLRMESWAVHAIRQWGGAGL